MPLAWHVLQSVPGKTNVSVLSASEPDILRSPRSVQDITAVPTGGPQRSVSCWYVWWLRELQCISSHGAR